MRVGWGAAALGCALTACMPAPSASRDAGSPTADRPEVDAGRPIDDDGGRPGDGGSIIVLPDGGVVDGAERYAALCASCHGERGEGASAVALLDWSRGRAALVDVIDQRMPYGEPAACRGPCAEAVADFVLTFHHAPVSCDERVPPARRLRLLTRREYERTVKDLLRPLFPSCSTSGDCAAGQSCSVDGVCESAPCDVHTFVFDAQGQSYATVHVAGSFNGWPGTVADGGWPLTFVPGAAVWRLERSLPDGEHTYKLVLNESQWIQDPTNPDAVPDGFGGQNSRLVVACAGAAPAPSLSQVFTRDFPLETRPGSYPFDNHAGAGLVGDVHVTEHLKAAARLAELAVSRKAELLPCAPAQADAACVEGFVRGFGRRALRRPLDDDEVTRYAARVTGAPSLDEGLKVALEVMLSSPDFLYRSEVGVPDGQGGYRLTAFEVASALSYLFWGTAPDDALLDAAVAGGLDTPDGIEAEARRLLADPKSREVLGTFAEQWLGIEKVRTVDKSPSFGFDDELRAALSEETRRFFTHVMFDGTGRLEELFTANYTLANPRLAELYELDAAGGPGFYEAPYGSGERAGVLGHGSVLAANAFPDQGSPIHRGLFVRQRLLCQEFGPPPAQAATVPEIDPSATTRERFAEHTADPVCASCHQYIDPVGFGFERFDAIGRARDSENGLPIDTSGDMNDVEGLGTGTSAPFSNLAGLGQVLAASESAPACFVTQVWRFAHGALEEPGDTCALSDLAQAFAEDQHDLEELFIDVVRDPGFVLRRGE